MPHTRVLISQSGNETTLVKRGSDKFEIAWTCDDEMGETLFEGAKATKVQARFTVGWNVLLGIQKHGLSWIGRFSAYLLGAIVFCKRLRPVEPILW